MKQIPAVFYDGFSSTPQTIEIAFNKYQGVLLYSTPSFQKRVKISEASVKEFGKDLNILFGEDPLQQIKIEDRELIKAINAYRKEQGHIHWHSNLSKLNFPILLTLSLVFLGIVGIGYFYGVPWVAERAVSVIPEEYDTEMGTLFFEEYIGSETVDAKKTKLLNAFASELQLNNSKKLNFTVVESDIVNAFALPDGNIVVYTGLLNTLENQEELVALLGHEVSHVNKRHSMKMLSRNLSGYILISAIFSDVNGITAVIGENIHSLQSLSYSRKFETEADYDAVDLMVQNHVDPNGMLELLKRLEFSEGDMEIPELLSSHPVTQERKDYIQTLIKTKRYTTVDDPKLNTLFNELKKG